MKKNNNFTEFLQKLTPDKIVGISGLAILSSASLLTFIPIENSTPPALIAYLGGLGLNVLSDLLKDFYSNITLQDNTIHNKDIFRLAKNLSDNLKMNKILREEINKFLCESNTLSLASEILQEDRENIGWLLSEIYMDIGSYRDDFDDIRSSLQSLQSGDEIILAQLEKGFESITNVFIEAFSLYEREFEIEQYKKLRNIISFNLKHKFSKEELGKLFEKLGFSIKEINYELSRTGSGSTRKELQIAYLLSKYSTIKDLRKLIETAKKNIPEISWNLNLPSISDTWKNYNWKKSAKRYVTKIQQIYGSSQIMGQAKKVSLEGIFTDVYLLDQPTAWKRFSIKEMMELHENRFHNDKLSTRSSGMDVVSNNDKLFVLGKPGAGKTTFLKYLAIEAAKGKIKKVPIFISLKEYSDWLTNDLSSFDALFHFIENNFELCDFPEPNTFLRYLFKSGKALLLFDGLDEISLSGNLRAKVIQTLKGFSDKYNECQYLITCRVATTDYMFENFTYVEMADFLWNQVELFSNKWFSPDIEKAQSFLDALSSSENRNLRELARTPLLLTMLCIVFEETLSFPQRRIDIYEEALDALFRKWDSSRNIRRDEIYRNLSLGRKRQMLSQIGFETFTKGNYFIREDHLVDSIVDYIAKIPPQHSNLDIDGLVILQSIESQHGILVERAKGIHSFSHLTYHEYFVSKYIVENAIDGTLDFLISKLSNPSWREVFLLTTSLLHNADDFLLKFGESLNLLIKNNDEIQSLLSWVTCMDKTHNFGNSQLGSRIWYITRDIERAYFISKTLEQIGIEYHYPSKVLNQALDYIRDIGDMLIPNEHLEQLKRDVSRDFNCYLIISIILAENYLLEGNLEIIKPKFSHFLKTLNKLSKAKENSEHSPYFSKLKIPSSRANDHDWHVIFRDFYSVYKNWNKQYYFYNFNSVRILRRYLRSVSVFAECITLGYVSDISKIYEKVLISANQN